MFLSPSRECAARYDPQTRVSGLPGRQVGTGKRDPQKLWSAGGGSAHAPGQAGQCKVLCGARHQTQFHTSCQQMAEGWRGGREVGSGPRHTTVQSQRVEGKEKALPPVSCQRGTGQRPALIAAVVDGASCCRAGGHHIRAALLGMA